jgi:IS30 family transposase
MRQYKQMSLREREELYALKMMGKSFREIGRKMRRSHTTLSREWRRNAPYYQKYIPCKAHTKAKNRGSKQRIRAPLKSPTIYLYVRTTLRQGWSPETIAGRLRIDHPGQKVHHETIYRYIYRRDMRRHRLWEHLTIGRKRRMKKLGRKKRKHSKIVDAVRIDKRPKLVERRNRVGHWETDNMEGPKGTRPAASVTVERMTRYTLMSKMSSQKARVKTDCVVDKLSRLPKWMRLTLTADNGSENAYHKEVTRRLDLPVYFCHPYHSWEKGSVENMIGRIRRFLPKGTDLTKVSDEKIEAIERVLNNTPRKCLGYLTPCEKMQELCSSFGSV